MKNAKFLLILIIFPLLSFGQEQEPNLRVGYTGSVPFVTSQDRPRGIIIDIWREVMFTMNYKNYELKPYPSIDNGMQALKNDEIDVLAGPVTITADRASEVTFSQPYFDTGFSILAPVLEMSIWERIEPFFSTNFLYGVLVLLFVLSLVGVLVWLSERRASPEAFSNSPVKGIGSGIWLALVTMTTVGYGDFVPKTIFGRIVIGIWMIISLITATSFVAGIASTLTLTAGQENTITKMNQLEGIKIAVPDNSRLTEAIQSVGGIPVTVSNVQKGYKMLTEEQVGALIYDKVQLNYVYNNSKDKKQYSFNNNIAFTQHYGLAFYENNDLAERVDLTILSLKETGAINKIVDNWLNDNDSKTASTSQSENQ